MSEKCQALLLMPNSRRHYDGTYTPRCHWTRKPDSNFCGVHKKLEAYIVEIIWKEDHGS